MRILIADDDPRILEPLEMALRREGHEVMVAADGERAWELFGIVRPDFAVLDIGMPGLDGLALTRRISAAGEPRVPVILLTGRGRETDKIVALDLGADDYLVKPCSYRELLARIRAVHRRSNPPQRVLSNGGLAIDPATHTCTVQGQAVNITTNEFLLLLTLLERAGQVVRYAALMQRIWGCEVSHDLLRVLVFRLRRKIEPDPQRPRYIHTVPGVGFLIHGADAPPEQPAHGPDATTP